MDHTELKQCKYSNLTEEQLQSIREVEKKVNESREEPVYLLAFDKIEGMS